MWGTFGNKWWIFAVKIPEQGCSENYSYFFAKTLFRNFNSKNPPFFATSTPHATVSLRLIFRRARIFDAKAWLAFIYIYVYILIYILHIYIIYILSIHIYILCKIYGGTPSPRPPNYNVNTKKRPKT